MGHHLPRHLFPSVSTPPRGPWSLSVSLGYSARGSLEISVNGLHHNWWSAEASPGTLLISRRSRDSLGIWLPCVLPVCPHCVDTNEKCDLFSGFPHRVIIPHCGVIRLCQRFWACSRSAVTLGLAQPPTILPTLLYLSSFCGNSQTSPSPEESPGLRSLRSADTQPLGSGGFTFENKRLVRFVIEILKPTI